MKLTSVPCLMAAAMLTCSGSASALDPQAAIYYEIPLGGTTARQSKPKLSLRLDRTRRSPIRSVDKRSLIDLRVGAKGVEQFRLRGRNLLD